MATTRLQIGPADHGRRLTLEEYLDAEEVPGHRYELARGALEVTEVPNDPHWQVVSNLQSHFYAYKSLNPDVIQRLGGGGECRVIVPEMISGRNPDVAVVFKGAPLDGRGRQPPGLVAEVVSRRGETRDYETKSEEYLVFGVAEYWIVDPQRREVTVLTRQAGPRWEGRTFCKGETIVSGLLPGFTATVASLWVDADLDDPG